MSTDAAPGRPTTISDAGPAAAASPAGLTPAEQGVWVATKALDAASDAVERHGFPKAGPEYDAKMKIWRERYAEWRLALKRYAKANQPAKETA